MTLTLNKGFWSPSVGGDPNFDDVFFLFQTPDSGSSLTDSSNSGFTLSAVGSAAPSTTQTKFQSQSLFLASAHTGTQASVNIRSGSSMPTNWTFAGDFTLEAWIFPATATYDKAKYLALGMSGASCGRGFVLGGNASQESYILANGGVCEQEFYNYSSWVTMDKWIYVAWTRSGSGSNNNKAYSGTSGSTSLRGQFTNTTTLGNASPTYLRLGGGNTQGFYLDSIRVTKGVARDVSSVPTSAFPTS